MSDSILNLLPAVADPAPTRGGVRDGLDELVNLAIEPGVPVALQAVRELLGMEAAYLSEIVGDHMVVRELDGDGDSCGLAVGLSMPREQTFCQRMLDGRIANLIPDVGADDRAACLAVRRFGDVGAFATVPVTFADGRLYGTLCAASRRPTSLGHRQLQVLRVFARLMADQLERQAAATTISQLEALVNAAQDAVVGLTPAGVVTSWNAASERILGHPADEAIGHNIIDLVAGSDSEDGMRRALRKAADGARVHHEGSRPRADGSVLYHAMTLTPSYNEHGQMSFISAVWRDISHAVLGAHYRGVERAVVSSLATASDVDEAAQGMLRGLGQGLDCELGALWELDPNTQTLRCSALWSSEGTSEGTFAETLCEQVFARGEELPGRVWATDQALWLTGLDRIADSARAQAAAATGLRTQVGVPLRSAGEIVAVVEFFSRNETTENAEMLAMGEALVARLADALGRHRAQKALSDANQALETRVRERTTELRLAVAKLDAAQIETVRRLSRAVEFRDHDTGTHIARISAIASRIARSAGMDAERCDLIDRASGLHDVGKVAIPDSVLLKRGPLTAAERSVIETHAEIGHRLLDGSDSEVLQLAATIALAHHEHYDGGGYPRGLVGENIPIEARIVAIADVFDALTSDRVYRSAMPVDAALAILRDGRGTHFDPVLLDRFLADINAHEAGPY
jgi:PAS domain S-box-containing protein